MTWVRLDDGMPLHPKLLTLSDGAFRLWINGLAFANRAVTDGLIGAEFVATLDHRHAWKATQTRAFVAELVAAGLWLEAPAGYEIHGYAEYQEEALKTSVEARKASARERKRRQRERERSRESGPGHGVTGRDKRRDTERDIPRDRARDAPVTAGVTERVTIRETDPVTHADARPGMSHPPVPTRPDPSNSSSLRSDESARVMPPDPSVQIAERYRREFAEHRRAAAPRIDPFDKRVTDVVLAAREQAEIDGCTVDQVLDRLFPAFWGSERAEELGHAPGALRALFGELLGRPGGSGGKRKALGPAPARPHSDFSGGPDFDAMSDAELKAWFEAPPEVLAEVSGG